MPRFQRFASVAMLAVMSACSGTASNTPAREGAVPIMDTVLPPELPDSGWGTHVLAVARSPHDRALWVGTYGRGIFVTRTDSTQLWRRILSSDSNSITYESKHGGLHRGSTKSAAICNRRSPRATFRIRDRARSA